MRTCPICGIKWTCQGNGKNKRDIGDSALKCYLCWGLEEPKIRLRNISKKTIEEHKERIKNGI